MTVRVLHLVGSPVSDFYSDLSRLYAQDCLQAVADPRLYDFRIAYVTPDLRWRFPDGVSPDEIGAATPMPLADAVRQLDALRPDVVLPQMFCLPGMTSYRALFDVLGTSYVGNPPDVMALGANKARARAIVAAAGVRVPPGEVLSRRDVPTIAPPAVVKPVDTDNSLGVSLVRTQAEFGGALETAFAHSTQVLVECYIELGREVRCGIVVRDGRLHCLPLEEYSVDSQSRPIRNYTDKIARGADGNLNLVAKNSAQSWIVDRRDPITQAVWDAARTCHTAMGCRDYSLFDFRIDPSGRPWFLEAGLYCSFARQSVIPVMADAEGVSLPELFATAIAETSRRG